MPCVIIAARDKRLIDPDRQDGTTTLLDTVHRRQEEGFFFFFNQFAARQQGRRNEGVSKVDVAVMRNEVEIFEIV